jgi:hypothetical protein
MNFTTSFKGNGQFILRLLTFLVLLTTKNFIPNSQSWQLILSEIRIDFEFILYSFQNHLDNS